MKKRKLLTVGFWLLVSGYVFCVSAALPPLRTQDTIRIEGGRIKFSGILADDNGEVYIEMPHNMIAKVAGREHFNFDGYIMAPEIITSPAKFPKARSREITSFDFLADDGSPVHFSDTHYSVPLKRRIFLENTKPKMIRVYIPVFTQEQIGKPELWYFDERLTKDEYDDKWQFVGGIFQSTSDPNVDLFSAVVTKTGRYTLFDRNPAPRPTDTVDPAVVDLAEDSPFPSVDVLDPQAPLDGSFDVDTESEIQAAVDFDPANPRLIQLTPQDPLSQSDQDEIPAVKPLPQIAQEQRILATVPLPEGERPSLEAQNQFPEGYQTGDELGPSVVFQTPEGVASEPQDDGRLPSLSEQDILDQISNPSQTGVLENVGTGEQARLNPLDNLAASSFGSPQEEGPNNLPKTGSLTSNIAFVFGIVIMVGTIYWYRREQRDIAKAEG